MYRTSDKGVNLIKQHEGLRLESYRDMGGVWTIGYGHTMTATANQAITNEQAEDLLRQDLRRFERDINAHVTDKVFITQSMFDALVSLAFNIGSHALLFKNYSNGYAHGSSLYNLLLQEKYNEAADRFMDFVKVNGKFVQGLYNRRVKEAKLFLSGQKKKMC